MKQTYTYGEMCDEIINNHDVAFYCDDIQSVMSWDDHDLFGGLVSVYKKPHIKFGDIYNAQFIKSNIENCLLKIEEYMLKDFKPEGELMIRYIDLEGEKVTCCNAVVGIEIKKNKFEPDVLSIRI